MTRRPLASLLALALLAAVPAAADDDRSVGRPSHANPSSPLARYHLRNVTPLTAVKAEKIVEGEARDNLPLERGATSWDEVGFNFDPPAATTFGGDDSLSGEVRVVPTNLAAGFIKPFQRAMQSAGFYSGYLIDGYFGVYTSSEVRRFQRKHGLAETGWADTSTVAKLNDVAGSHLQESAGTDFVGAIRTSLRYLGYYDGKTSGTYSQDLKAAVSNFQVKNEVKSGGMYGGSFKIVRGWVDSRTADRINELVSRKKNGE